MLRIALKLGGETEEIILGETILVGETGAQEENEGIRGVQTETREGIRGISWPHCPSPPGGRTFQEWTVFRAKRLI